jgi:protein-tyrosine phosphatase
VRAAALLGYDLPTEKRSSQVLLGDLTVAKLILVMELHHKQYVRRRSISFDQKTFMLGHWLGKEIPDPMGRDLAAFEAAAHLIDQAIDTWLPRIDLLPTETAKVTGE